MMLTAARSQSAAQRELTHLQRAGLSFTHNFHHPTHYYVKGMKHVNDYNTDAYEPHIKAFLTKRWMTKREIPPKISVMADMGDAYRQVYFQQRLAFSEFQYDEKHLERLYANENINSQFLHSIYFQDYEKNMAAECMQKQVMNGAVVPLLDKPAHDKIKASIRHYRSIFY